MPRRSFPPARHGRSNPTRRRVRPRPRRQTAHAPEGGGRGACRPLPEGGSAAEAPAAGNGRQRCEDARLTACQEASRAADQPRGFLTLQRVLRPRAPWAKENRRARLLIRSRLRQAGWSATQSKARVYFWLDSCLAFLEIV